MNSQLSNTIFAPILPTEPEDHDPNHSQGFCEWVDCDLEVLWVELKQILHLKVSCLDFGPVQDRVFIKLKYATSLMHKFC